MPTVMPHSFPGSSHRTSNVYGVRNIASIARVKAFAVTSAAAATRNRVQFRLLARAETPAVTDASAQLAGSHLPISGCVQNSVRSRIGTVPTVVEAAVSSRHVA